MKGVALSREMDPSENQRRGGRGAHAFFWAPVFPGACAPKEAQEEGQDGSGAGSGRRSQGDGRRRTRSVHLSGPECAAAFLKIVSDPQRFAKDSDDSS